MRRTLLKLGLVGSLIVFAVSLFAADSPAPLSAADTNFIDPELLEDNPQVKKLMEAMEKEGMDSETLMDESFLFASLLWGSVGVAYVVYARKQRMIVPFVGGVAMIGVSYFVASWIWMSLACIALMIAVYQLMRRGY